MSAFSDWDKATAAVEAERASRVTCMRNVAYRLFERASKVGASITDPEHWTPRMRELLKQTTDLEYDLTGDTKLTDGMLATLGLSDEWIADRLQEWFPDDLVQFPDGTSRTCDGGCGETHDAQGPCNNIVKPSDQIVERTP